MSRGRWRIVLFVVFLALAGAGVTAFPTPPEVTVAYEISGSGPAEVRYADSDGALATPALVALPWRKTFTVPAGIRFLTVTAGRTVSAPGDLGCRITVAGELVALDGLGGGYTQCTGHVR